MWAGFFEAPFKVHIIVDVLEIEIHVVEAVLGLIKLTTLVRTALSITFSACHCNLYPPRVYSRKNVTCR